MTSQLFSSSGRNLLNSKAESPHGDGKLQIALVEPPKDSGLYRELMEYVRQEFDYYIPVSLGMSTRQIGVSLYDEAPNIAQLQDPTQIHLYDEAELHIITGRDVANELEDVIKDSLTDIGNEVVWDNQAGLEQFLEEVSHD